MARGQIDAVQDSAPGLDRFKFILVFSSDNRAGVNAMIRKSTVCKILFQLGNRAGNIYRLVMEHHSDDIIGRTVVKRPKIAAFILWEVKCYGKLVPTINMHQLYLILVLIKALL